MIADVQPRHLRAPDAGGEPAGVHAVGHAGHRAHPALRAGEGGPHLEVPLRGHRRHRHLPAVEQGLGRRHEAVKKIGYVLMYFYGNELTRYFGH